MKAVVALRLLPSALALVASCSSVELGPPTPLGAALGGALLPSAAATLTRLKVVPGAIGAPSKGAMRTGDQAWLALELRDDGSRRQWLLELLALSEESLEVQQTMTLDALDGRKFTLSSGMTMLAVTVHGPFTADAGATVPSSATAVAVPGTFLREGLAGACEVGLRSWRSLESNDPAQVRTVSDADMRTYCSGFATLVAFLQLVQNNDVLSSVLWEVIDKPSPLAVLFAGFSISLGIDPHFHSIEVVERPVPNVGVGYRLPLDLRINDTPALRMELLVVSPDPPLQICGGIVAIEGRHPARPNRRLSLWLVAASSLQQRAQSAPSGAIGQ